MSNTAIHDEYSAKLFEGAEKDQENLLVVKDLYKYFPIKSSFFRKTIGYVKAVDGISFKIKRGTTMGLVGESGCGKTTVGRTILRLTDKSGGEVLFNGREVHELSRNELRALRRSEKVFLPQRPQADCDADYRLWKRAVGRAADWIEH